MLTVRTALISVSDKTGLEELARTLVRVGARIVSTGGTGRFLRQCGFEITDVSAITDFPEILGGRVKALHPKIHAGLLHLRGNEAHEKTISKHGITPIDMVIINLYPFDAVVANRDIALDDALDAIDIGGQSLIRSGAKNYASVAVVTCPSQYGRIVKELAQANGRVCHETLAELAVAAFRRTSQYEAAIHLFLQERLVTCR